MLAWLPIVGPIIEGIFGFLNKKQDNALETLKTNRTSDIQEAQISANMIQATKDDIGLRLMRDLVCFPVVVWSCIIGWDTIVAYRWAWLKFNVPNYPESVGYLPYAVLIFLLGNIGINTYKRK